MKRHLVATLVVVGGSAVAFPGALGCINVNARVPDVSVYADNGPADESTRWTPYGRELQHVLDRQSKVEKKLAKRDWEDVQDDVADWDRDTRRLMAKASTCDRPEAMRQYTRALLSAIDEMKRAARARDPRGVQAGLDRAIPWLNRLGAEFPTVEPAEPSGEAHDNMQERPAAP
jgi:hypothetical protein